jgi:hypothetical protein
MNDADYKSTGFPINLPVPKSIDPPTSFSIPTYIMAIDDYPNDVKSRYFTYNTV